MNKANTPNTFVILKYSPVIIVKSITVIIPDNLTK